MKTSPLRLDDAFINGLSVRCDVDTPGNLVPPFGVRVDANPSYARHKTDPLQWIVKLHVEFGCEEGKPLSYSGSIDCEGFFTIADTALPEATQRKIVAVNAATILYGTAREAVASITARSRYGKLLLPSVSFIEHTIQPPETESAPKDASAEPSPIQGEDGPSSP